MSSMQTSTQSAPNERFGRQTQSRVGADIFGALQAPSKQDMLSIASFSSDTIPDFQILDTHGLHDPMSTRDAETDTAHSMPRTNIHSTSHIGGLEHLLSGMASKQQFPGTDAIADMDKVAVIGVLNKWGFFDIANRLKYLHDVTEEDEEDIKLDSLRGFATFVIKNWYMHPPQITVTDDGLIQAVWKHHQQGTLVMDFQESGDIAFTLLYGRWDQGTTRRKLIGELSPDQVTRHVKDFIHDVVET